MACGLDSRGRAAQHGAQAKFQSSHSRGPLPATGDTTSHFRARRTPRWELRSGNLHRYGGCWTSAWVSSGTWDSAVLHILTRAARASCASDSGAAVSTTPGEHSKCSSGRWLSAADRKRRPPDPRPHVAHPPSQWGITNLDKGRVGHRVSVGNGVPRQTKTHGIAESTQQAVWLQELRGDDCLHKRLRRVHR